VLDQRPEGIAVRDDKHGGASERRSCRNRKPRLLGTTGSGRRPHQKPVTWLSRTN
jgi:hypothetical protein